MTGELERLRVLCAGVGFDLGSAKGSLVDRMRLLAEHSKTFDDASRMTGYAERVFRHTAKTRPVAAYSVLERQTVILACLFSDIGKTGPEGAGPDDRRLIVEAFAVENVRDDKQPIGTFLRTYFPADAEARIARFVAMGIDPAITLRQFWNLHSGWTLAVTEAAGLPPEAVAAAATHHLLDDVNPEEIVGADHRFTRRFGDNVSYDRAEKLVTILDKYDAVRRRGHGTHEEAIAWLRDRIAKNPRFAKDDELLALVGDVDIAIGSGAD